MRGRDSVWSGSRGELLAVVVFFSFMLAVLGALWAGDADWMQVEVTGYDGVHGFYPGIPFIAIGPDDTRHMTYSVDSDLHGHLAHGFQDESGWSWSEVRSLSVVGVSPMTVDTEGVVHTCCVDQVGRLRYLSNESGTWVSSWSTLVPENVVLAHSISIAVDSDRNPHIAFWSKGDLKYATNRGGHWSTSVVLDTPLAVDTYTGSTSIALDGLQRPHIAATYDRGYVGVFSQTGEGWVEHPLFDWDLTFDSVSIAPTDDGSLYVAYYGSPLGIAEKGLTVATLSDGNWQTDLAMRMDAPQGFSVSMAVSPDDEPWICMSTRYQIVAGHPYLDVRVLRMTRGEWRANTVEQEFAPSSSIALDSNGVAYLAFPSPELSYWTNDVTMEDHFLSGLPAGVAVGIAAFSVGFVLVTWIQRRQGKKGAVDPGGSRESPGSKERE